jgi:hypothetical protein
MTASFLQASLFTSVLAFGVAVLAFMLGILLIVIGVALRSIASVTRDNVVSARPSGSDRAEVRWGIGVGGEGGVRTR